MPIKMERLKVVGAQNDMMTYDAFNVPGGVVLCVGVHPVLIPNAEIKDGELVRVPKSTERMKDICIICRKPASGDVNWVAGKVTKPGTTPYESGTYPVCSAECADKIKEGKRGH